MQEWVKVNISKKRFLEQNLKQAKNIKDGSDCCLNSDLQIPCFFPPQAPGGENLPKSNFLFSVRKSLKKAPIKRLHILLKDEFTKGFLSLS